MARLKTRWRDDAVACLILVVLWLAFFWQFMTPVAADQVSLVEGDFSGQFVAFGAYQAERFWQGEVPLWNPYNNGGLPFLADTQAAVFYPPRLVTIALAGMTGSGWTYHTLELEMLAHMLLASFLMYVLVRRLTLTHAGSVVAGLAAALTWTYGGFLTGYPPLQLALLEAAVWGPLLLLGIHEATAHQRFDWCWLLLSGFALGLSAMAGHPQTNWFLGYLYIAFLAYRVYLMRLRWTVFAGAALLVGGLAVALAAVQLLPAFEYLQHTTRLGFGFDAKANGFPPQDIIQLLFPRVLTVWSPLYFGLAGLVLAGLALWRRARDAAFWGLVALIGLLFSFGGNAAVYRVLYNVMPGLKLFRGQERAALVIALSVSVLVGLGMAQLVAWAMDDRRGRHVLTRALVILLTVTGVIASVVFVLWMGPQHDAYDPALGPITFSALMAGLTLLAVLWLISKPRSLTRQAVLLVLIAFDLFTVGHDNLKVDPVPPFEHLARPEVVDVVLNDDLATPFRVDGQRGVLANYGTMWGVQDIRGISPLWLAGPYSLMEDQFPAPLAWELMAVRYVFSDWSELPVPTEIVADGADAYGPVNVHRLEDPRPFAMLIGDVALVDNDEAARALMADPAFQEREVIILESAGEFAGSDDLAVDGEITVTQFAPENVIIEIEGNTGPGLLSIALPQYPGWKATVDGQPTPILRAYGAMSAVQLTADASLVQLTYDPLTFKLGALASAAIWLLLAGLTVWFVVRRRVELPEQQPSKQEVTT